MHDHKKAQKHIEFLQLLKLTGDFTGHKWTLLPWQVEIISDVYGTVDEEGWRKYKYAYLEIPKKNGKTELIAGLAVDHLYNDPPDGQIYCCAAERGQAALVYRAAKLKIEQEPRLKKRFRIVDSQKEIHNRRTGTFIRVLSSEDYSKHGLNPSVIIFDELHALQKRGLWDTMTFGSGAARKEQLTWIITTAGDDPDRKTVGWEQHEYARKVRDGEIVDPTWYVKIYGAPEDADIWDERVWYAANPSLGVTIDIENVRQEALLARNLESAERQFRWLRLNQWIALKRVGWLPQTLWDRTQGDWGEEDMLGRRCYAGIDLSTTTDLSAITLLFPMEDGTWRFFTKTWVPEDSMRERSHKDHVPYEEWVRKKYMQATPGGAVDYGVLAAEIAKLEKLYRIEYFCSDPWRLSYLRQLLPEDTQDRFVEIAQNWSGMSCGMLELERLFRVGEISHGDDPVGRWSFGNVRVATDGNENIKPTKKMSIERIDPTVSLVNAMAGAIRMEPERSVYEGRGIRTLG